MKRFLLTLMLLLFVSTGFADSAIHLHTFTPGDGDLSVSFLGQIFGTVGTVLHGNSGQMLGAVFKVLNEGFVVVAGLWLFYTVLTVVLRSATEGSFLGQNKNTLFIFVRVAFGIGLLLPMPGSGYSAFQQVVMFVVEQGVGLANQTWDAALDYVGIGGSVYTPPENNQLTASNSYSDIETIAGGMACMSYKYNALLHMQDGQKGNSLMNSVAPLQHIVPY